MADIKKNLIGFSENSTCATNYINNRSSNTIDMHRD